MTESTLPTRPASPLAAMLKRWPITLAAAWIGALLGVVLGIAAPTTYTAEARLAVAPDSNSAYAIAGFPTASRDLAANYARWVQNNAASGDWKAEGVASIGASPVPESGVIRIEAKSTDQAKAVAGADKIADQLQKVVSEAQVNRDPKVAYQRYADLAPKVSAAQSALERAQSAYGKSDSAANAAAVDKARTDLALIMLERDAQGETYKRLTSDTLGITQIKKIAPAAEVGSDKKSKIQLYGLFGLVLGLGVALALTTILERRRVATPTAGATATAPRTTTARPATPAEDGAAADPERPTTTS